ncbi:mandelate racemase/muconate lactonizing enzyme family protein [Xylophilus sp.]|uniref:mandelate racemase/muconate lactonizing enzyme family protein n=1 Tax=Xylophilus sp. TaxID=2653893 RepID=UPI0013B7BCCB|nr:mandelate racemase/muconate lactonizing enzyme family protein [Xylophilus sp.]KAF1047500.1 MAG: D-galactonate dehydratase family member [Xylophilus sp.]
MKISKITPYFFNPRSSRNLLLIRVEAEDGTYGWGECYTSPRKERVVEMFIREMTPYVIGRSVFDIRHTWKIMFDDFAVRRGSVDLSCAWSGIEIATWDIIGKIAGLPVYKMLGGANREKIRLYANGWADQARDLDELCDAARKTVAQGWSALKWDPFSGPWRTFIAKREEDAAVENVRVLREAVGPGVELLIDAHRRVAPQQAIFFARRVESYGIMQLEDPSLADNMDLVAQTREASSIPIVTGETLYSKEQFIQVFERRAADVINPDVTVAGGILACMEIAAMAEPYGIAFSPHNNNTTVVGLAATLHLAMASPNFLIGEYFVSLAPGCDPIGTQRPRVENGWGHVPDTPGLGIDVDIDEVLAWPYQDLGARNLRHPEDEFPKEGCV